MGSVLEVGDAVRVPDHEAHHLRQVLRARTGDVLEVVDARRRLYLAELCGDGRVSVLEALEEPEEPDVRLSLYQAVPKGGRMDLVVEKATEVGATRIVPLLTERGIVRPREAKVDRWRRVAEAAARQSLRLSVPEVDAPVTYADAVREAGANGVLLHNRSDLDALEAVVGPAAGLFVGPEGGWSDHELRLADGAGLAMAQLGPFRLRSETAGVVAVARARASMQRPVRSS